MRYWTEFQKLDRSDRQLLLVMSVALPLIAASVRILGFVRVFSVLGRMVDGCSAAESMNEDEYTGRIRRLTRYIKLRGIFRGNCLSRSLLMWTVLKRKGIECELIFGSRFRDGQFQAHAWVERNSLPLNAGKHVRRNYVVFDHDFESDQPAQPLTF